MGLSRRTLYLAVFLWIVLAVGAIGFLVIFSQQLFRFRALVCMVENDRCPDYVEAEILKKKDSFIFSPELRKSAASIEQKMISYRLKKISVQSGQTLYVEYEYAAPRYVVLASPVGTRPDLQGFVVDEAGIVVEELTTLMTNPDFLSLPQIRIDPTLAPSLAIKTSIQLDVHQNLIELLDELQRYSITTKEITYPTSEEVRLVLSDGIEVYLSPGEVRKGVTQLYAIRLFPDAFALKAPISSIDLRYKYPVIKTFEAEEARD